MRISLQPAYILHHRPFRETSVLLDVFTHEYGRISLVARGVRTQRSKLKALLQPFVPLLLSWQGKSELMTLISVESQGAPPQLRGDCLLSAFYLNELLVKVLQKQDAYPNLFLSYKQTLDALATSPLNPKYLRIFEKNLLEQIGYGLPWQTLLAECCYRYDPDHGFKQVEKEQSGAFKGEHLLAFANEDLNSDDCLYDAKRLMRLALAPLLGDYEVQSKELFKR